MPSVVTTDSDGLAFGGASLRKIACEFGTPFFVYDGDAIRCKVESLFSQFCYRPFRVHYSIKANPLVGLITLLRDSGVSFDACSRGDLAAALAAGCNTDEITFVGHGLDGRDYTVLEQARLRSIVADSEEQIRRFARFPDLKSIGLRVNPLLDQNNPKLRSGSAQSRFGIPWQSVPDVARLVTSLGMRVEGLHAHIGSDIVDIEPYMETFERLLAISRLNDSIEWINVGGGYGFTDHLGGKEFNFGQLGESMASMLNQENVKRVRPLEIRVEPGGFLMMDAGLLVCEVVDAKLSGSDESPTRVVTTNTSSNHLMSAVVLGVEHPIWAETTGTRSEHEYVDIAGNLMHAGDVLARHRWLPRLEIGDLVAFGRSGAYTSSRSTTFNGQGRPAEVLVLDGVPRLIRARETPEDLIRLDRAALALASPRADR